MSQPYLDTLKNACSEGRDWARGNSIQSDSEAWTRLQRPDWMLWLAENRGVELDESKLRLFACDCAEQALPLYERDYPDDKRPRQAIAVARRFANGEATREELAAAWDAAKAAAWAAAWAAGDAAKAAAWAAWDAAKAAAWAAARAAALAYQADKLREYLPDPFEVRP